jgi:hypothetical protein
MLPAEASVEALLDGAFVHSWDAHTILSLEGVVTVILERLTPGRRQTHPTILELRI